MRTGSRPTTSDPRRELEPHRDEHPRYQVIEALPGATQGSLLRVRDRVLGQDIGLRALPKTQVAAAAENRFRETFLRLGRLDHPHLARVHDLGWWGDSFFYTRELARGLAPQPVLKAGDEHGLVQSLAGLADALGALHSAGLVHGLAVPDHLRVPVTGEQLGSPLVTDAGLHLLLGERQLAVWRNYLPRERRRGGETSPAGDIYSLGAALLEALGGEEALGLLAGGEVSPFRQVAPHLDRHLLDLLDRLVDRDPGRRPRSGIEVLRWMRDPGWAVPERAPSVGLLVSPELVGREAATAALTRLLERAALGASHAGEIIGTSGLGRSRLLVETSQEARRAGWVVVPVEPRAPGEGGLDDLSRAVAAAVGLVHDDKRASIRRPQAHPVSSSTGRTAEVSESAHHAQWTASVLADLDATGERLLLVCDNAERLPADLAAALSYLVTEAGSRPLLVLATRERAGAAGQVGGLPDAEIIPIGPLGEREMRQLLAPLLGEALNPDLLFTALQRASAGSPLWVRLLLAEWLATGRLRFTHGRPFFDERTTAAIPDSIVERVAGLLSAIGSRARDLLEALAVWGEPMPDQWAEQLSPGGLSEISTASETLVVRDRGGRLHFAADTLGSVVFDMLTNERRQHWHAAILEALDQSRQRVGPGRRAFHLLAAGRTAEAARDFIAAARQAESAFDFRRALDHYRQALAHLSALPPKERNRTELALAAARLAVRLREPRLADELLAPLHVGLGAGEDLGEAERALRFEAQIIRSKALHAESRHPEAEAALDQARALAATSLDRMRLDVEVAAGDYYARRWVEGDERIEPVVEQLAKEGPKDLLALALHRWGLLRRATNLPQAAALALQSAWLARSRRIGDHVLAASAFISAADCYFRQRKLDPALRALDRARIEIAATPHDANLAAELNTRSHVLIELGRTEEAERLAVTARAVCLRSGNSARLATSMQQIGRCRRFLGRLETAESAYREAEGLAVRLGGPDLYAARGSLGEILFLQGELEEAERLLNLALKDSPPPNRGLVLINLGELLRHRARFRDAVEVAAQAESELSHHLPGASPLAAALAARIHLDAGDLEAAELRMETLSAGFASEDLQVQAEVQLARGLIEARSLIEAHGLVAEARGLVADSGGHEPPYEAFDTGLAACRQLGDPILHSRTLIAAIGAALELPEPRLSWLERAVAELRETAARTDARPLAAEVQALSIRVVCRQIAVQLPGRSSAPTPVVTPAPSTSAIASLSELTVAVFTGNRRLGAALAAQASQVELVGRSPAFTAILARAETLAPRDTPVLIAGEPGTGKTALAVVLHETSGRPGPLIVIDAVADPGRLHRILRSIKETPNSPFDRFEKINIDERTLELGTLLIEEVTALDRPSQQALLDLLGGKGTVRVVATTTVDLAVEAHAKRFHRDLARRLTAEQITIPPLRARETDLELLVAAMARQAARSIGSPMPKVSRQFHARCAGYSWPGNLTELRQCVTSAVRLATGGTLNLASIPEPTGAAVVPYRTAMRDFERRVFSQALAATRGNVPQAARLLRLPESTFRYRAAKLKLMEGGSEGSTSPEVPWPGSDSSA